MEANSAFARVSQVPMAVPPSARKKLIARLASARVRGSIRTIPAPVCTIG